MKTSISMYFCNPHSTPLNYQFCWVQCKNLRVWNTLKRSDVVLRGRLKGLCTLSKVGKTWGFCSISKNDGRRGTFEEDLQRCISRGRRSTKDMFIRDVTVKGQSRSDSLLLSPYHWEKLFRGVVAIVAVPTRFAVICWIVLEALWVKSMYFRWVLGWPYKCSV